MKRSSLAPAQIISDSAMAVLALALAYWIRYQLKVPRYIPGGEPPDPFHYAAAAPVLALSVLVVFALMGVYRHRRGVLFIDEFFGIIGALAVTGLVVLAMMGLWREFSYSRVTFLYWVALVLLLSGLARYSLRRRAAALRARGVGADRALVIGHGAAADLVIQRVRMFPDYGYQLVGVVSDVLPAGTDFQGVPVVGETQNLEDLVRRESIRIVFVALVDATQDQILHLMDRCQGTQAEFRIVPSMLEIMTTAVTGDQLDGIPLLQLRRGLDIDGPKAAVKRLFDLLISAATLVLLAPVLAVIALLVRTSSPGPVLIAQERVGRRGRPFRMLKYRTMRVDAEVHSGPVWASAGDPRRTRVGAVLRRFSLDELPQLWNIFRGSMSLVGPRAERPVFVREFNARLNHYGDRHRVRPGLTGWAQANDLRGQTPVEERLIYDLYYIENWSLAFDLKIILITLFRVFTHKNAY
ncbi:MAG: undecaprenyl-phosphate glucose phosphotransferase [Candidatus Dormibacteraeota bacterium]|nr:undecaprenyl-phosphate glucose phosphotransferase [Candidatus Dormibacteraeota bacterium]